ncbi:oxidoreductase [Salinibacterium xinjiangense]|uniref:Predicted dehydrogenase n=1 Tax=Salinibacterium xinjiangense TaxID=386302 RepID=A0A2C9A173_9MICO|nr:Gfo/Idh/MocA family oxidoreductase [Salinibacterium xinjiangense]GGL04316.1 oxidoreductase [Salinibacterium xinjiangense]SOE72728.1 Predicted dehydrogenase [Salinibacterium xinjiangense]
MSSFPSALPESSAIPVRGGPTLNWGVLGPGGIADAFVSTLHANSDQRVLGVGSRSPERAAAFAAKHGIPNSYGSYEALVGSPDIDVVYIAAPHSEHRDLALLALAAGKHVLVEKPIALSAAEAREIAAAAAAAGLFAMEALWTRFQPKSTVIRQLLDDGVLGELRLSTADLGFRFEFDPNHRLYNMELGGGALLDLGVYPVWFNHFVMGVPDAVRASGSLGSTGVDDQAALTLEYANGARGIAVATMLAQTRSGAEIAGTAARIEVEPNFIAAGGFTLHGADGARLDWRDNHEFSQFSGGLVWQAAAVAKHISDGRIEAPEHPLSTTIAMLETIDDARTQLGYPPR